MIRSYERVSIGDIGPSWTSMSRASMARVMDAILRTDSKLLNSYVSQIKYAPRTSVYYSLEIPTGRVEEFEAISGYKTKRHSDIQLGMETYPSVKSVTYDLSQPAITADERSELIELRKFKRDTEAHATERGHHEQ